MQKNVDSDTFRVVYQFEFTIFSELMFENIKGFINTVQGWTVYLGYENKLVKTMLKQCSLTHQKH